LQWRDNDSDQIKPILDTISTLPAAQQVPLEVFGCLLQASARMAYLQEALLKFPQAQHITPVMQCKALLAAAKTGFRLLVPPFLRCGTVSVVTVVFGTWTSCEEATRLTGFRLSIRPQI
jgi:hypothetical protein